MKIATKEANQALAQQKMDLKDAQSDKKLNDDRDEINRTFYNGIKQEYVLPKILKDFE